MAQGFLVGKTCEPATVAVDLYWSSQPPATWFDGYHYNMTYRKIGDYWYARTIRLESSGWVFVDQEVAQSLQLVPCDPAEPFFDGVVMGWGVAAAMVFASSIALMRKGRR